MDISKQSGRRGSPVKKVDSAVDGHSYYIINGDDASAKAAVHFIDFYGGLAMYSPVTSVGSTEKVGNVEGFFFVRNAADMSIKGDGQGDPTVHSGWAMYIWDAKDYVARKPATNAGWVKITQQGDMDWDITDELKSMFVLKTVFNARVNEVDNRFSQDEAILKQINNRLIIIENDWPEVLSKVHWHDNKEVLDELSDKYTFLYYRGRPISGNSYVYDHVEYRTETSQKEIVWCDPTKKEAEWTHEIVKNSDEIAQRFLNTDMARIGLSLFVIEVDGSISIYKYDRGTVVIDEGTTPGSIPEKKIWNPDNRVVFSPYAWPPADVTKLHGRTMFFRRYGTNEWERIWIGKSRAEIQEYIDDHAAGYTPDGYDYSYIEPTTKLVYKFAQTIVMDNHGIAEYVETLPTATKWHYGRGCWVPLKDDGEHIVGHLHVCVEESVYETEYHDASGEVHDSSITYYQKNAAGVIVPGPAILIRHVVNPLGTGTIECIEPARMQAYGNPILREADPAVLAGYRYYWKDIHDSGSSITATGATFTIDYAEDTTLWKTIHLFWKDPEDTVTVAGVPAKWNQTILVRKYGSAPADVNDGVTICTSSVRNEHESVCVTDVIPQTNEVVYYRLFSRSKAGGYFAAATAVAPTKLDWTKILEIIRAGNAAKIFAVGDEIVLPPHATYGDIVCEVVAVNKNNANVSSNGLLLVAKGVLCKKIYDCEEPNRAGSPLVDNPEWTGSVARGSNGYIHDSKHDAGSLNVIRWLNSAETTWWVQPVGAVWDMEPTGDNAGYKTSSGAKEAGFLNGFEESDRAIFKELVTEIDGDTIIDATAPDFVLKVSIPMYDSFYFANISKYKQLGKASAHVEWGTLTGEPSSMTEERSRMNYGFKTIQYDTGTGTVTVNSKIPESLFGVVPMFFIG